MRGWGIPPLKIRKFATIKVIINMIDSKKRKGF